MDLDTLWVRPLARCPSHSGHCFACLKAAGAPRGEDPVRFWKLNWVVAPDKRAWLAFPLFFPAGSPVLLRLLRGAAQSLRRAPDLSRRSYLLVMKSVVEAIHQEDPHKEPHKEPYKELHEERHTEAS